MESTRTPTRPTASPPATAGHRALIVGWCVWLLGSWLIPYAVEPRTSAARWLVFGAVFGAVLVWPALRLSLGGAGRPWRAVTVILTDWVLLNGIFGLLVLFIKLNALWGWQQALWQAAATAAWSALAGVLAAWGRLVGTATARLAAMLGCVLLLLGEPAVMAAADTTWTMRASPLEAVWAMTARQGQSEPGPWRFAIASVGLAAAAGWAVLLGWAAVLAARRRPGSFAAAGEGI